MAYVYRHIRLDKNEIFYIGIGSDNEGKYKRAYSKCERNKHWLSIVSKSDYEIDIILDDLTWEQACQKEEEFIKLYGRKDLNEGSLVNMTNGGEGTINWSKESKQLLSDYNKNLYRSISLEKKQLLSKKIGEAVSLSWKNKTKIERLRWNKNVSEGWNNRSIEDKDNYKKLKAKQAKDRWSKLSEEEKTIIKNKISETLKNKKNSEK
jgi:hypothetical protein